MDPGAIQGRQAPADDRGGGLSGVAADLDEDLIASLLPAIEAKAREMQPKEAG